MKGFKVAVLVVAFVTFLLVSYSPISLASEAPEVETAGTFAVGKYNAVLHGRVNDMAGEDELKVFFRYGEALEEDFRYTENITMYEEGTFVYEVEDLKSDTGYYFKAGSYYDGEEIRGNQREFITEEYLPVEIETLEAEDVTYDSAVLKGELSKLDVDEVEVRFEWREEGDEWESTENWTVGNEGEFTEEVEGLVMNTTYEYRAAAEWEDTDLSGSVLNFTTEMATPEVTEPMPEDGTPGLDTKVELQAELSYPAEEEMDVYFRLEDGTLIEELEGVGEGTFSAELDGLERGETYGWYVEVEYRNESTESETWTFGTADEETVNRVETDLDDIDGELERLDAWLEEHREEEIDTGELEDSVQELRALHVDSEALVEEGRYGDAEEELEGTDAILSEIDEELERLEGELDEVDRTTLFIGLGIILAAIAVGVLLFLKFLKSGKKPKGYNYDSG